VNFGTQNNKIYIDIPYYWQNVTVDPSMSVLVTDPPIGTANCNSLPPTKSYLAVYVGVTVSVVGVILAIAVVLYLKQHLIRKAFEDSVKRATIRMESMKFTKTPTTDIPTPAPQVICR